MVLKQINIYGFKSFADRLDVKFEDGMTGIVGPNGCGKSNVADAIRWVLGEQSAKTLRGANMQDVIFNGTTARKSMSYCEVSLIFDNSTRIFPIEFNEVSISRKLYRSGDSEYLLNGTTCRLKDITDLLHDTGVSKEGYSIIGQGNVEKIFNSRPEERRAIFEDAVGIAKHKAKKNESERKLARANDNLEKLNYIIADLEERIGPLEKQSIAARKYFDLCEKLRYSEVNAYIYQYENSSEAKRRLYEKLEGIGEEAALNEAEFNEADRAYNAKTAEQNKVDIVIEKLREEKMNIAVGAEKLLGNGKLLRQRLEYQNAEKERLEEEIKESRCELDKLSERLLESVAESGELKKKLDEAASRFEIKDGEYSALESEINRKENEEAERTNALLAKLDKFSDVKADISELETRLEALEERKRETEISMADNKKAIEQFEARSRELEIELSRRAEKRSQSVSEYNAAVRGGENLKRAISVAGGELRELSGSVGAAKEKLRILKENKENYYAYNNSVGSLMKAASKRPDVGAHIDGVVAELLKIPVELETAIETALGGAMQNIVTRDEEDAKYLIELLRRERMGRVTFLPLSGARERGVDSDFEAFSRERGCLGVASRLVSYDKKYSGIMSSLLGRTLVFKDIDVAIAAAKKCRYAYKIVTLEGDVFAGGAITGGSRRADGNDILKQDRMIEEAEKLLARKNLEYEQKAAQIKDFEGESAKNSAKIEVLSGEIKENEIAYATVKERFEKAVSDLQEQNDALAKRSEAIAALEEKIGEYEAKLFAAGKRKEEFSGGNGKFEIKNKELFVDKKQQLAALSEEKTALKVRIATFGKELDAAENEIARVKAECDDLRQLIAEDGSALAIVTSKIAGLEDEISSAAAAEKNSGKMSDIELKIEEAASYKQKLQTEISEASARKDALSKALAFITEKRVKTQSDLEKIDEEITALGRRIEEEYELTYDKSLEFKDENFDIEGASAEITRLKREISRLGNVNTGAIEDYAKVSQKYEEFKKNADDMMKAKADLEALIADLVKDMVEKFETEFKKINENFKQIFKELFGGGFADLVLDDECEDPLEAGIEIMAQPPGKNLKNIMQLSGGEKTMTAIAILFAILRLRPLPFCLLDEVEAALDDANAGLVAKYIKKYSDETQFILITHRKPTMEICDRLYGVTMEEKGVSKMVSVRLSEAVKQAE